VRLAEHFASLVASRIGPTFSGLRKSLACVCLLLAASWSLAQQAEVTRNVNLREDPSTANQPIRLLTPPETVTLIEPDKTGGYYHVRTVQNEEGWVWAPNVHVLPTTPTAAPTPSGLTATPAPGITPSQPPTPSGLATTIDPSWPKGTPVEITSSTASGTCGPDGDPSGDKETCHLKNRVDVPSSYHEVTFDAILKLPKLPKGSPTSRESPNWPTVKGQITPFEGVAVSVVGFLVNNHPNDGVKVQGSEKTNCGFTQPTEVDWHVPLAPAAGLLEKTSIVVEVTPRVRKDHPNWTTARLDPLVHTSTPVRISGWLMFDPDHPAHLGVFRATLWEIHPITKIEVRQGGVWKSLDQP
jgi:hypothetical protein